MTVQSLSLAAIVIAISKCLVGNAPYPVFSFMLGQFVFVFIAPILNIIPIEKKCQFLILVWLNSLLHSKKEFQVIMSEYGLSVRAIINRKY